VSPAATGRGVRCTFVRKDQSVCRAWATKASIDSEEGARCYLHLGTAEERSARARKAANASGYARRAREEPLPQSDLRTGISFLDLYKTLGEALVAVNELGGADWSARLAACAVLVLAAPRHYRTTPEEAQQLLARMLPKEVPDPERLKVEAAFKALRAEYWSLPLPHPIRGLVARDTPRQLIAPWEDLTTVERLEKPKDVPLNEADTFTLPNGQVALKRDGAIPVVLDEVGADVPSRRYT
jgi:hypothetical protein